MLVKYLSGMADDEECCPLCVEPYEPADKAIQFCVCGFQICMFCWKKIRETGNGCCPACRHQYTNEPMLRPARKPEEYVFPDDYHVSAPTEGAHDATACSGPALLQNLNFGPCLIVRDVSGDYTCLTCSVYALSIPQTAETSYQSSSDFDGCDEKAGSWSNFCATETSDQSTNAPRKIAAA